MNTDTVVIDIGNTSTSLGVFRRGRVERLSAVKGGIRQTEAVRAALERCGIATAGRVIAASVVPADNAAWTRLLRRAWGASPLWVTHTAAMPIGIAYPKPETIGADRLANAVGAFVRYGAPAIVADFGTALTFDVLDAKARYVGGVIAPGLPLMTDYLYEKTALLPRVTLAGRCLPVGTSTEAAIKIGAKIGHRGMVRETVAYLRQTVGPDAVLCATGGYARWALDGIGMPFHIDPDLTLFGLAHIG
ncbi:MAG: type III pantothenate kinase [Kiritimatiellaeota bacterium]|nr:type III pantothenate kinase [Kiritimatiellota bacterium]